MPEKASTCSQQPLVLHIFRHGFHVDDHACIANVPTMPFYNTQVGLLKARNAIQSECMPGVTPLGAIVCI